MKQLMTSMAALAVCGAAFASAPTVSDVTMTQDASRAVTVTYTLSDEPAIVTVDIRTNGVSIGGANLTHFSGDVNKVVQPGAARTMTWRARKAWPGHKIDSGVTAVVTAWALDTPPDVMIVPIDGNGGEVQYYADLASVPGGVSNDVYKTTMLLMRKIPAANVSWSMGSPVGGIGADPTQEAMHVVTLTNDYYMGVYEFTQAQFNIINGAKWNAYFKASGYDDLRPVEQVSWEDLRGKAADECDWPANGHAVLPTSFIGKLRTRTGLQFDLPTEAEWEFACRAGTGTALNNGQELIAYETSENINAIARYKYNGGCPNPNSNPPAETRPSAGGTANVGSYEPNAWGLYDMLGNVYEWCLDWWQTSPLGYDSIVGPESGTERVRRGGAWNVRAAHNRSGNRNHTVPNGRDGSLGFRLVLAIPVAL